MRAFPKSTIAPDDARPPIGERLDPSRSGDGGAPRAPSPSSRARRTAVEEALASSEEAAARRDYRSACAWLNVVEAIGGELPSEYLTKRRVWASAIEAEHYAGGAARAAAALAASLHVAGRGALGRLRGRGRPGGRDSSGGPPR